jgi:protocatechuate 3,4-dioxygenase beta subunit
MLLVALLTLLFAPPDGTISGTVRDARTGEPLRKASVVAEPVGAKNPVVASTVTNDKGQFSLQRLEPGQYRVTANRNGYLDAPYGAKPGADHGPPVTLETGHDLEGLQIRMQPWGVIAGVVRDSDGEPVSGAHMTLFRHGRTGNRPDISGVNDTETDYLGQYSFHDLAPGRYSVRLEREPPGHRLNVVDHSPPSDTPVRRPATTFYPRALDPAAATIIEVAAGARVTGIDMIPVETPLYKIRLHVDVPAGLLPRVELHYTTRGYGGTQARAIPAGPQDFTFVNVPPGSYTVVATAAEPEKRDPFVISLIGSPEWKARVPVQVSADIDDLRVTVTPGAEVRGHITVEAGAEGKTASVAGRFIMFESGDLDSPDAGIGEGDTFRLRLATGHYAVNASSTIRARELYVKSIRSGDNDIFQQGFTVSGPAEFPVEIVLGSDGASVEGLVLDQDGKPAAGATVVLVPAPELRERADAYRVTEADQTGRFQIKGIAPGESKLFAWPDVEENAWLNPAFLKPVEAQGEPVKFDPNDRRKVTIHLVRQDAGQPRAGLK